MSSVSMLRFTRLAFWLTPQGSSSCFFAKGSWFANGSDVSLVISRYIYVRIF